MIFLSIWILFMFRKELMCFIILSVCVMLVLRGNILVRKLKLIPRLLSCVLLYLHGLCRFSLC